MAVIGIIDDYIVPKYVESVQSLRHIFLHQEDKYKNISSNHATMIMKLLEKYADDNMDIVNIVLTKDFKESRSILELKDALNICIEEKLDIICMSLGTTWIYQGNYIQEQIEMLSSQGVIMVAAMDNNEFYMLPAAMPEVIGVEIDRRGEVLPGEYIYLEQDIFHGQLRVNCDLKIEFGNNKLYPSTSYAVPIIAAKINNLWNQGIRERKAILKCLRRGAKKTEEVQSINNVSVLSIPTIMSDNLELYEWRRISDLLHENYEIEAVGVDFLGEFQTYLFMSAKSYRNINNVLAYLEGHSTADLFLVQGERGLFEPDIWIEKEKLFGMERYICRIFELDERRFFQGLDAVCQYMVDILS